MHSIHPLHLGNPWAILVSAVIQWLLGAAWYSPALFAKPWVAALGIDPHGQRKGIAFAMICSLVGSLILSFVLWHMIGWAGAETAGAGAFVGFLCWLGFIAAPAFPQGLYERRPTRLFLINSGYWLVAILISGALLAVWR